jgi:hypothetical protein
MRAIHLTAEHRCDWTLMLIQDTTPSVGFVPAMLAALRETAGAAALVPDLVAETSDVSSCKKRKGRLLPCMTTDSRPTTAVHSCSLLRVGQVELLPLLPVHSWLDHLDHWVFRWIRTASGPIGRVPVRASPRLSVSAWEQLPAWRAERLLVSERDHYSSASAGTQFTNRAWLIARVMAQLIRYSRHRHLRLRHAIRPSTTAARRFGGGFP